MEPLLMITWRMNDRLWKTCLPWGVGCVFPHPGQSFRRKLHATFVSFVERTGVCMCVCPVYILSSVFKLMQL